MKEINYFMVGMPSGGKTSYIVRLCEQLLNKNNTLDKVVDGKLPDGLAHIREQMDKMDGFQKIVRTFENVYYDVGLPLIDKEGESISLRIPDLSGEYYRKLVEERYIEKSICDGLKQADEILFFVNTETMEKEERLRCDEKSTASLIEKSEQEEGQGDSSITRAVEPEKATQSQVVELLQIILNIVKKRVKIKFVMSAWDRIEKKQQEKKIIPEDYVKDELPLLYQYMNSNRDIFDYEVFGVSAQGVEYDDTKEMEKLEEENIDIDTLVKVIMPDGTEDSDLSRVLRK